MNRILFTIFALEISSFATLISAEPPAATPNIVADTNLTKQISSILTECQNIKPGMTRAELEKLFTPDGGISTSEESRYSYRSCLFIKIDVEFHRVTPKIRDDHDTITKISKPYLEQLFAD